VVGETNLSKLLASLAPHLIDGDFVFCTIQGATYGDFAELLPIASFREAEGLTLVVTKENADKADLRYEAIFKGITLNVHSSLEAVGLTAAVSSKLAARGVSANVIAAYYHDHIFVPADQAGAALSALNAFSR
jgi:hypothetical protein